MSPSGTISLAQQVSEALVRRNDIAAGFFAREASRLAEASHEMSERFQRAGRLLAFGRGAYATDAQHVSVEFVHPVIVGKRALPALDISAGFGNAVEALVGESDIVMGFGPPDGDVEVAAALANAKRRGAMTFALPGCDGSYAVEAASDDPFVHQEVTEVLYHVLWETVHVFFEHTPIAEGAGHAGFLYPFLGGNGGDRAALTRDVAGSIIAKVADDGRLRVSVAERSAETIAVAVQAMAARIAAGGTLLILGNGGSATDANDFAHDCIAPPGAYRRIPAISLSTEPAIITAIANDVGSDVIFLRQLIAHARPGDVVVAFSTSGGSRNVIAALEEARRRSLLVVAILGYDGGEIRRRGLADHCVVVESDYIPRIQEIQASIYHVMRDMLGQLGVGRD
ncbi:MAG: SIS domain-containing protein [Gemmatimonadales bacterium]